MDYKKEIQKLIDQLKYAGYGRTQIEEDTGNREGWIANVLSRGGNAKAYRKIKMYYDLKLHNTGPDPIKNADYLVEAGEINARLIRLEAYVSVLFSTSVEKLSRTTGRPAALLEVELHEAISKASKLRLAELRRKS